MCPGVDLASKNEYQAIPRGKDGRCITVMNFMCRVSRNSGALTYQNPKARGLLYLLPFTHNPIQWVLMLKRLKHETDYPPPTIAGVRNDLISDFSVFVYFPDLTWKTLHFPVTVVGSTAFPLLPNLVEKL
jgi:hypothetical protein